MPAGNATVAPMQQQEPFDALVAQWVQASNTLPRKQAQRLLKEELWALRFYEDSLTGADTSEDAFDITSLADRRAALTEALDVAAASADPAALRHVAEAVTVSTDLDTLYDVLESGCVLDLLYEGKTEYGACMGADDVVSELWEQQEAILGCRSDLATRRSATPVSGGAGLRSRSSGRGGITVRAVSEVKSWVVQPGVGEDGASPTPQVGTQVTYYADAEMTLPVFTLHTACTFTEDDDHRVEHIRRALIPHNASNADSLLRDLHFGTFSTSSAVGRS